MQTLGGVRPEDGAILWRMPTVVTHCQAIYWLRRNKWQIERRGSGG
jgi:hypothetical protein